MYNAIVQLLIGCAATFLWEVICSASDVPNWLTPSFVIVQNAHFIRRMLSTLAEYVVAFYAAIVENMWEHITIAWNNLANAVVQLISALLSFCTTYYHELMKHLPSYHVMIIICSVVGTVIGITVVLFCIWKLETTYSCGRTLCLFLRELFRKKLSYLEHKNNT